MIITVQPDRILIGDQPVPRFLDLPQVKQVLAGETWEPGADETYDYIEILAGGTLRISRTRNTTLRFVHLFVHPSDDHGTPGVLDCGTDGSVAHHGDEHLPVDPIPATVTVEFIVRNVPIDTVRDPFQWGNGLLNFGRRDMCGATKLAWTSVTGNATGSTLELVADPVGWQVGDELLLPDMTPQCRREAPVFIKSIAGRSITLSKPLDFAHDAIRSPRGTDVVFPRVANLTRNIVLRSEGTIPGHVADAGHHTTSCVCYTESRGLGRTKNFPIHNSNGVLPGGNQVGRYTDHLHMMEGFGTARVGNVYRDGIGKWAQAIHGTHDVLVTDNIAFNFKGAGFVTEDGYEIRNVYERNFAAYCLGNFDGDVEKLPKRNDDEKNPGAEGAGFWFRGTQNILRQNEAWCCHWGIDLFAIHPLAPLVPSVPGGDPDTPFIPANAVPVFEDNVTVACIANGLDHWGVPKHPNVRHVSAHCGHAGFFQSISSPAFPYFIDPLYIQQGGVCIHSNMSYSFTCEVEGGYLGGGAYGVREGGAQYLFRLTNVVMQNAINIGLAREVPTPEFVTDGVVYLPLPGHPFCAIEYGTDEIWSGIGEPPDLGASRYDRQFGPKATIRNHQGIAGNDFQIFMKAQLSTAPAWPSVFHNENRWNVPEVGLTNEQAAAKYGMALWGAVIRPDQVVPFDGLTKGLARKLIAEPLGPPRAVPTVPASHFDATTMIVNGEITIRMVLTGDGLTEWPLVAYDIDGTGWLPADANPAIGAHLRVVQTARIGQGQHTITTLRGRLTGPGTVEWHPQSYTQTTYPVGATIPPPPPVHCVQGDWVTVSDTVTESPWVVVGDHEERTVTTTTVQERPTITFPANGGTPCGPSTQTLTSSVIETRPIAPGEWVDVPMQGQTKGTTLRVKVNGLVVELGELKPE